MRKHEPVLLRDFINLVVPIDGCWIDGTFGSGGYSRALLKNGASQVLAIDRDPNTKIFSEALKNEFGDKIKFFNQNFADLDKNHEILNRDDVQGMILDLGISSMHVDDPERGFSFREDGPLDMRMGIQKGPSAKEIVNHCSESTLADIIFLYGQERRARKIAYRIVQEREKSDINTTLKLAQIVRSVVPRNFKTDPATRTFQAIRIAVNNELKDLFSALMFAIRKVKKGGILGVVTFHSLEDKLVKDFAKTMSGTVGTGNRYKPSPTNSVQTLVPVNKKPVVAACDELARNNRARSAKLRVLRKVAESSEVAEVNIVFPYVELGL